RISTRGNALALISPIVTGCPMAFASCAASVERTASPVKTALAQRNPPPRTMSAATSTVTAILFFIFLSRGAPPPRADALGALFNARGAPPPLASLARSRSLEPQALPSRISRTERRRQLKRHPASLRKDHTSQATRPT